jgi:hypothetical protein
MNTSFKTTTWTFVCYPLITVIVAGDFDQYSTFVLNREMLDEVKADSTEREREREMNGGWQCDRWCGRLIDACLQPADP